jgi:predicted PurR-regulated permease PerM
MENRWRGLVQFALGSVLAVLFFYMMASFLVPLGLAAVFAIIWYPAFEKLTVRLPRALAALVVTLGVIIGILLPIFFLVYAGSYKVLGLITRIRLARGSEPTESLLNHPPLKNILDRAAHFFPMDQAWLHDQFLDIFRSVLERVSSFVAGLLAGMPGLLMAFAVVVISIYFFLVDGAPFLKFLSSLSPMKPEKSNELFRAFERSCRGVVLGLFLSALAQAALMTFFLLVTGVPNAWLLGAITMVLSMIPLLGSAPISIGAVIYLFVQDQILMAVVMIVGAVAIATSDNVVRSWVMKGRSEMHPLLALVSVFGAVNLLGPTGIFLGPIIAAVFVSFLKIAAQEIRREKVGAGAPSEAG